MPRMSSQFPALPRAGKSSKNPPLVSPFLDLHVINGFESHWRCHFFVFLPWNVKVSGCFFARICVPSCVPPIFGTKKAGIIPRNGVLSTLLLASVFLHDEKTLSGQLLTWPYNSFSPNIQYLRVFCLWKNLSLSCCSEYPYPRMMWCFCSCCSPSNIPEFMVILQNSLQHLVCQIQIAVAVLFAKHHFLGYLK